MTHRSIICAAALLCGAPAFALDVDNPMVQSFVARLADQHGFVARDLNAVLSQAQIQQSVSRRCRGPRNVRSCGTNTAAAS